MTTEDDLRNLPQITLDPRSNEETLRRASIAFKRARELERDGAFHVFVDTMTRAAVPLVLAGVTCAYIAWALEAARAVYP
jgi:hypothetical protein